MFDPQFCIIDLFGHSQIAGLISEQEIAGQSFIRIDVPEVDGQKAFTRFYGPGAIYAIQPVDKETCLLYVKALRVNPIDLWTLKDMIRQLPERAGKPTMRGDISDLGEADDDYEELDL